MKQLRLIFFQLNGERGLYDTNNANLFTSRVAMRRVSTLSSLICDFVSLQRLLPDTDDILSGQASFVTERSEYPVLIKKVEDGIVFCNLAVIHDKNTVVMDCYIILSGYLETPGKNTLLTNSIQSVRNT